MLRRTKRPPRSARASPQSRQLWSARIRVFRKWSLVNWQPSRKPLDYKLLRILEARVGIEPTHKGFADLSLTTWVPRPRFEQNRSSVSHCTGNSLGASTSGDLGKVGQESRRFRRQFFDQTHRLHEYSRESSRLLMTEAILTHTH